MSKYCSDCAKLNIKGEKYPGCYECKKKKKDKEKNPYVWACQPACENYEFDWSRGESKRQEVFKKALKEIHVDRKPMKGSVLILLFIVVIILWIIMSLSS